MAPQIWFWLIYFLVVVFALYNLFAYDPAKLWFRPGIVGLAVLILIGILGYVAFGSAVQGGAGMHR